MMGHALRRCGFKIKVKWKGIGKKKRQLSGLLFFLSILEAGASAVAVVQDSQTKKKIAVYKYFKVKSSSVLLYLKYTYVNQRLFYFD